MNFRKVFKKHMIQPEFFIADLAGVFRRIFLRNRHWSFLGFFMKGSMTNAFLEGGKLLRANVTRKEWYVKIFVFFLNVTS